MRVLVTGGAGFIGSHIADRLLADGHEVCVVDDLSSGRRGNVPSGARFEEVDIRDAAALLAVVSDFRPEAVSHQAAQTSVSVSVREPVNDAMRNVVGTLNLLEACRQTGGVGRIVFASTGGAIYGEVPEGQRAGVDFPMSPLSPYACSKLACEKYLAAYEGEHGHAFTVLRYANVYGPRQDPHGEAGVVAIFSQRLLAGESINVNAMAEKGDRGCVRDYVYVADVVEANARALAGQISVPVINVGTGVPTDTQTLADTLKRHTASSAEVRFADRRAGDLKRSVLDPGDASLWAPTVGLEEGLAQTAAWFRDR